MSDDEEDFAQFMAATVGMTAAMDQLMETMRPCMRVLAGFEAACVDAGMSARSAAAFTMKMADAFGWPPVVHR